MSCRGFYSYQAGVPSIAQLVARAAAASGISIEEVAAPGNRRGPPGGKPSRARWAVMKAARECRYPLKRIGERLGGRDHSTISYGLRRAELLVSEDSEFAALVMAVRP